MESNANTNAGNQRPFAQKSVVKKVCELHPDFMSKMELVNNREVGDYFVIAIVGGQASDQLTIHHPIGITDLNGDQWVMTRSVDIHYLLARAKDPGQEKLNAAWQAKRTEWLVSQKILEKEPDGRIYYAGDKSRTRVEVLQEADNRLKEARREAEDEHNRIHAGKPKKPVFKFPFSRDQYLDSTHAEKEKQIRKSVASEDAKKYITSGNPQTYRTRGGPLAIEEQKAITVLDGMSSREAQDRLMTLIEKGVRRNDWGLAYATKPAATGATLIKTSDSVIQPESLKKVDRLKPFSRQVVYWHKWLTDEEKGALILILSSEKTPDWLTPPSPNSASNRKSNAGQGAGGAG